MKTDCRLSRGLTTSSLARQLRNAEAALNRLWEKGEPGGLGHLEVCRILKDPKQPRYIIDVPRGMSRRI